MCRSLMSFQSSGKISSQAVPNSGPGRGAWGMNRWAANLQADHPDPAVRVTGALSVVLPAALGAAFIFAVLPWASWIVFAFGWMLFPAVGQLVGGGIELGRRAIADLSLTALAARVAPLTIGAEQFASTTALDRIERRVVAIVPGPARTAAEQVAAATVRLASLSTDPTTERMVRRRFIEPTADLLVRYTDLATLGSPELCPALTEIAADLPRLAAKLDAVAQDIRTDAIGPAAPAITTTVDAESA